jgi:hypothetical protein
MSVYCLRFFLFAVMAFSTVSAQAGWLCEFLDSIPRDTKRRNCWPKPFVCQDRQFARTPFALQVVKGWQLENTLGAQYFNSANGRLNEAGRLKVQWILFEEPAQYRSIYVNVGQSREETDWRLKSVQEYAAQLAPEGELPLIAPTTIPDRGTYADHLDFMSRDLKIISQGSQLKRYLSGGSTTQSNN